MKRRTRKRCRKGSPQARGSDGRSAGEGGIGFAARCRDGKQNKKGQKMTENNETKHSPTPWALERKTDARRLIMDAGGNLIVSCWGNYWDYPEGSEEERMSSDADAAYILEAVNAHERLVAENARLRELVRRMGDEIDDMKNCLIIASAIAGTTRDADSEARVHALLAEACAAIGEEAVQ